MYGLSVCTDDNHSLKLVAYRLVHTDELYINLHLSSASSLGISSAQYNKCNLSTGNAIPMQNISFILFVNAFCRYT